MAFSYYKTATIDHAQCGAADSSNFPVLINLAADGDLKSISSGGFVSSASGYDIRPYADALLTTPLTFELVTYTASTGALEMWVSVPTLSHTADGTIYLAFGDSSLTTDGSSSSTWDTNYKGVWHFKDGTTLALTDSTSNANNGTNHSATVASGQVDGAVHMAQASAQYVDAGSGASLNITGAMTIEGWIYLDSLPASFPRIVGREDVVANLGYAVFYSTTPAFTFRVYTGSGFTDLLTLGTFTTGTWVHFVGTMDVSKNGVVYLNGAQDNTGAFTTFASDSGTPFLFGARNDLAAPRFLDGKLDEVRISAVARGAEWAQASYNNQKSSSTFLSWGFRLPVPYVSDTFTDAAGTILSAHTGEIGATWTSESAGDFIVTDANRIRPSVASPHYFSASGSCATPNGFVEAILHVKSAAAGLCGIAFRHIASGELGYIAFYDSAGTFASNAWILTDGSFNVLNTYAQALTNGQSYTLRLKCIGTVITVSIDGTPRIVVTNSAHVTGTKAAVFGNGAFTNTTGMHLDSINGLVEPDAFPDFLGAVSMPRKAFGGNLMYRAAA